MTLTFMVKFNIKSQNLTNFELLCAKTRHPFKLEPPNLVHICKLPSSRTDEIFVLNDLGLQGQIPHQKSKFSLFWAYKSVYYLHRFVFL